MLSSKKLALANSTIAALTAQLTAAGMSVEDLTSAEASPTALKDAIAAQVAEGSTTAESVIADLFGERIESHDSAAATAYLEEIAADAAQAESLQGQVTAYETALSKSGIRLEAPAEGEAHSEESIQAAITARVSTLAQERTAGNGVKTSQAPEVKVSAAATDPAKEDKGLTGLARLQDAIAADFSKN